MATALIIQNARAEGPGQLGRLLQADGIGLDTVYAPKDQLPKGDHDLLVILGGPQSANDDLPYLRAQEGLIRRYHAAGRPVLGICLGSQLIARALGGRVYRGHKREVGLYGDLVSEPGARLFAGISSPFEALHLHEDTFDLPPGSARLASSASYENQAFCAKSTVGLQFHLEADEKMARQWLQEHSAYAAAAGIDAQKAISEAEPRMPQVGKNMAAFYAAFKSEFGL